MLNYNIIFFAECQDGNGFLFHFINFAQTQVIFYSKLPSKNIPFFAFYVQLFSIEIIAKKAVLHLVTHYLHKKRSRIAALYTKKPPRTPPQWEESSAVFVYQVYCGLRTSFCTAFCPHQRYFRMVGTRMFILIGFATWSFIPASSADCLSSEKAFAVIAMMGMPAF